MQKNLSIRSPEQGVIDSVSTVTVPELRGLKGRDAQRLLKWLNLEMEYSGDFDGLVVRQNILPGSKVEKKRVISVMLSLKKINRTPS